MIDFDGVEDVRDEVVDGILLARSIIAAMPRGVLLAGGIGARGLRADVLALLIYLRKSPAATLRTIADKLGMSPSTAHAILKRAEADGLIERRRVEPIERPAGKRKGPRGDGLDARQPVIVMTPKGKAWMRSSRGARRRPRQGFQNATM